MKIELKPIETISDRSIANRIIMDNHSYVPTIETVGRHLDYLIMCNNKVAGMIGIGSATYPPCKDVLTYLNMTKYEYLDIFNSIANNWKFCLCVNEKNLGTQVLKQLRERCQQDWYNRYNDELHYLMTFVGADHNGAVYKADNWQYIGKTAGLPEHNSLSMKWDNNEQLNEKFVKPTGENQKLIFIKKLKSFEHKIDNKLF